MSRESALKLLDNFDLDGWESIQPFFNTFDNFYKYLKKSGVDSELTLKEIPDELYNYYAFLLLQDNPEKVIDYIVDNTLTDIHKKSDGYYLRLRDREEISEFFKETRYENTRKLVKNIMGEDWWEPYYDTTDNVYRDVIEELTPDKLKYFKERVLNELKDKSIEINGRASEEMELIASEQGHDDHFFVTSENIDRVVDDEETMQYLLKYEIADIRRDLYSLHGSAYNTAYTDEIWKDVMDEISTYFEPEFRTETVKVGEKTKYVEYIKIKDLHQIIYDYLDNYKDSHYNDDLMEYHGSFTGILTKMMDEMSGYDFLDFRIPDYADSRLVDRYINEMLGDYL